MFINFYLLFSPFSVPVTEAPGCPSEVDSVWEIEWASTERSTLVIEQCSKQPGTMSGSDLFVDYIDS